MLGLGRKNQNSFLKSLSEPAFLFGPRDDYKETNDAGQAMLRVVFGAPEKSAPVPYPTFKQILRFSGGGGDEGKILSFDGKAYEMLEGRYEEGPLLRLIPVRSDQRSSPLSQAMDVVPWGLVAVDLDTEQAKVVFSNKAAGDILEVIPSNMVGLGFADILRVFGVDQDVEVSLRGTEKSHFDYQVVKDEKLSWYRLHFIPYSSTSKHCLVVMEDRTDTVVREGQFMQAQRLEALGQLAGGVAHDFNNILSIIDGYARIARKNLDPELPAHGFMEHIAKAVQRGSALTSQLLTFGRHKVTKEKVVDLGELVEQQKPLLYPLMDATIALKIKTDRGLFVEAAPDALCQILMNLCINSRDAMPEGGDLIVECLRADNRAVLQVMDTGCGMPEDVQRKMFDPFFTTKDQGKGTGLGLSMVYGLVQEMDGEITVSSKPGKGTVIRISLPLSAEKPKIHQLVEEPDGSIRLNGFTALIAEDEPDLLDLVSGMMEEMGAHVLRARNGNEALSVQDEYDGEIDFLLTDVVMPELNGVRLAELFHECRPESAVMFMSGYPANGQMARVEIPEGAFLMPKPVDFEKLKAIVRSVVQGQNENLKERWSVLTGEWRSA